MIRIRKAEDRGQADFGWLKSQHSFSFASYYDPKHMGVSSLRVINDDRVAPGAGFDTHGHRDMEIISYVISGTITHKDSFGNVTTLPAGEFQLMSAGKGIYHSEFNASNTEGLHFLQIWIQPDTLGIEAGYQQKAFEQTSPLTAVVTPTGENGTLKVQQDATLYRLLLDAEEQTVLTQVPSRNTYVQVIEGRLNVNDMDLTAGDGAHITEEKILIFNARQGKVCALVFDLA
ncbi:pirin family protein [Shewanella acanthi]|uniref:pirin family protein n=1 Tax=Shewanella acanthi TaxID=2864212 RepID=UPI001C66031F|nr:pirin family protein [Shewanella acanthi]QYJ79828.1 pirin family protein [Shewanella acanthi]